MPSFKFGCAPLLVLALCLGNGAAASAAGSEEEAKAAYKEGTKYYSLGNFAKAAELFKKAFEIKPDPIFLYNIAQSYRLANDIGQAIFFYKSYLRNLPEAPNRKEVEGRIREMEDAQVKQRKAPNEPLPPSEPGTQPPKVGIPTRDVVPPPPAPPPPIDSGGGTANGPSTGGPIATNVPPVSDTAVQAGADGTAGSPRDTAAEVSGQASDGTQQKKPLYKEWWVWAAAGAVVLGIIVIAAASGGGGTTPPPMSHFGNQNVF